MRVLKLTAENFKRLHVVAITPKGDVIKVTGRNEQGKSSVLDALWAVMGGKKGSPEQPIRKGSKSAKATVDLGELVAERKWTESGSTLTVTNKAGARFPNPQKVLDELIGQLTFDPLAFMGMDAKAQANTLRQMVGLDFSDLDMLRTTHYQNRTVVNRDLAQLEARGQAIVVPEDAPDAEEDAATLLAEIQRATAQNNVNKDARFRIGAQQSVVDRAAHQVRQISEQLSEAQFQLDVEEKRQIEITAAAQGLVDIDTTPMQERVSNLTTRNAGARAKAQRRQLRGEYSAKQGESETLTQKIDAIDKDKADRLAAAKFPVPGLSFDAEGSVTLDGMPLSQISQAQRLKVSMAMAMAMNPKLRVLRITDASLLDSANMAIIEHMAADNDFQVWLEVVDESGKVGIVIEDGEVIADNQS